MIGINFTQLWQRCGIQAFQAHNGDSLPCFERISFWESQAGWHLAHFEAPDEKYVHTNTHNYYISIQAKSKHLWGKFWHKDVRPKVEQGADKFRQSTQETTAATCTCPAKLMVPEPAWKIDCATNLAQSQAKPNQRWANKYVIWGQNLVRD